MIFIWIRKMAWCEHTFPCSLYFLEYDRQPKLVDTTLPSFPALQAFLKNMFHFVLPSLCVYTYLQAYVWTSTQENIRQFSSLKKKISCWACRPSTLGDFHCPSPYLFFFSTTLWRNHFGKALKNLTLIASFLLDRVSVLFKQKLVIMTR